MITEIDGEPITAQNVAQFINEGKISNLTQIMWVDMIKYMPKGVQSYSYSYDLTAFQGIIDNLSDNRVKVRTVEAMELNCKMYGGNLFRYKDQMQNLLTFLGGLKQSIENYDLFSIEAVKRLQNPQSDKELLPLPKELDNKRFKSILEKAIEARLVEKTDEGYKWNGQKNELALFAASVSKNLSLSKRENSNGTKQISWQPFEILFGVSNLRGAYNDIQKTGTLPKTEKEIEKIING